MKKSNVVNLIALCVFGVLSVLNAQQEVDLFREVIVKANRVDVVINEEFKKSYLLSDFFVEYDADINLESLDSSLVIMPCLMNIISIVWLSGNDYYVDSMDENLFYSLKKIKQVFKVLYPNILWSGNVIPRQLVKNVLPEKLDPEKNIALLYSGGLDSTVSSYFLAEKHQLLITAWGAYDMPLEKEGLWLERKRQLIDFGLKSGYESSFFKSNYSSFLNRKVLDSLVPEISSWRIMAVEGIGWAGLTAPILFQKGYQVLYIASSDCWEFDYATVGNPYIDNTIKFADCSLQHHLFDFSRVNKIEWIVQERKRLALDKIPIKACLDRTPGNCGNCKRCLVTIAGLLIYGDDVSKYDYFISREVAVERLRALSKRKKLSADDHFHFNCLVSILRRKLEAGEQVPEDLLWLLEKEFDVSKGYDVRHRECYDWKKLHKLCPEIECKALDENYMRERKC